MPKSDRPNRWKRYEIWDQRPLRLDSFATEDTARGFCAVNSPYDPKPGLTISDGRVVEMDGIAESDFDMLDIFIVRYHLDLATAEEIMALDSVNVARMLVDIDVPRDAVVKLTAGMTPAKLVEVPGAGPAIRRM
jgi:propanediol dehydratase large subunit